MTNSARRRILLSVTSHDPQPWIELLSPAFDVVTEPQGSADPAIDYAIVWKHPHGVLSRLPNLKAILSLGAGVDHILTDPNLPDVPVARVVAQNLTRHMTEYVAWRVLDHHRQGFAYRSQQKTHSWNELEQPEAGDVRVGIMGLGQLGMAAAQTLLGLGFKVNGWTRAPRKADRITTFHGSEQLAAFLAVTDILVVLLPHTKATEGIIDYELLNGLRRDRGPGGAVLINAGRGKLQNDRDILRALEDGLLKEASLDVFEHEPLDPFSPLWSHPGVFITPHAAAASNAAHLVPLMLEQFARLERGEKLENLVDINAGY